jgi:hypothetical protein
VVTTLGVLISLSARALRHLLARLVWPPPTDPARVWAWSLWRRRHQARARRAHRQRRQPRAELARDQSRLYGDFRKLAQRGLELLADAPADRRERLQDMHDFYGWLEREMPALWARWRREQQEQEPRGGTGDG